MNDRTRRAFRRRAVRIEAIIRFKPPESLAKTVQGLTLVGFTKNISEIGMSLVVSANNIDRYLKQKENGFLVRLSLPSGPLELHATPVHYKRFSADGVINYLIGSSFQKLDDDQLTQLVRFLRELPPPQQQD